MFQRFRTTKNKKSNDISMFYTPTFIPHSTILKFMNSTPSELENYRFFSTDKAKLKQTNISVKKIPIIKRIVRLKEFHIPAIVLMLLNFLVNFVLLKIANYLLNTDENSTLKKSEKEWSLLFAMLMSGFLVIRLYLKETQRISNRTNSMSQNLHPSNKQLKEVIDNLLKENSQDLKEWMNYKKIDTTDQLIAYFQKLFKKGICFGYAMSTIDAVSKHPNLTGCELIEKIDYSTALKKHILSKIRDELFATSTQRTTLDNLAKLFYENGNITYFNYHHDYMLLREETNLENIFLDTLDSHFTSSKEFLNELADAANSKSLMNRRLYMYIQDNLKQLAENILLTGYIDIKCPEFGGHAIMFRTSNSLYYFIDCNYGPNEYATLSECLLGLKRHILFYYGNYGGQKRKLEFKFNFHAIEHEHNDALKSERCAQHRPK